jgi:ABC-2 type transport system permease protein
VLEKYGLSFTTGLKAALEYRANFLLSLLAVVSPIVIQTVLWLALYAPGDVLFGYTFGQMVAYTVLAQLVSRLVRTGFEYQINDDIRTGGLDRFLIKPLGYFGYRLAVFLGDKSLQTLFVGVLLAGALGVLAASVGLAVTPLAVGAFLVSLVVALVFNFLLFWLVAMAGFWMTETVFLFEAVRIVIITLSGGIFPLTVFGPAGEAFLKTLPFRFTIQVPVDLLTGRLDPATLGPDLGWAVLWILVLGGAGRVLWALGLRRFSAVGS